MSSPWRAVEIRNFEQVLRTIPKVQALRAIPHVRTELQLRRAWFMTRLTMEEYVFEEIKRSKKEKLLLMTHLRDLMICEGAAVACAKKRDALCFVPFFPVPALNTCTKTLANGSEKPITFLLQGLMNFHQIKLLRVNK